MRDQRLNRKIVATSLDLPWDEDVQVNVNKTGINGWGLVGVALAAALPGLGAALAVSGVFNRQPAPPPAATSPVDSEYEVKFYDRHGKPIDVPPVSTKP